MKNSENLYKKHGVLVANAAKPYIDNLAHTGKGTRKQFVVEYNTGKLVKDRKVFAALTDDGMDFYNKNGIKTPKNFDAYKHEQEYVISI